MAINRIDNVVLVVPDLEQGAAWYEGVLGMRALDKSANGYHFSCGSDHSEVTLVTGQTTFGSFAFGADDQEDLKRLAAALREQGVPHEMRGGETRPGEGKTLQFTTPAGQTMTVSVGLNGRTAGKGSFERHHGVGPCALDHINLLGNVAPEVMRDFWTAIGFKLAIELHVDDSLVATWLRSTRYDHDVAYMRAVRPSDRMHHVAFSIADIKHLTDLSDRLMEFGHKWEYGIGRHNAAGDGKNKGFGTNIFAYARDPFGHRNEFCTDVDVFDDDAAPLISRITADRVPDVMNGWATNMPQSYLTTGT